jgi:hypothetical protein
VLILGYQARARYAANNAVFPMLDMDHHGQMSGEMGVSAIQDLDAVPARFEYS